MLLCRLNRGPNNVGFIFIISKLLVNCLLFVYSPRKQQLYHCDEMSPFIQSCIERFEKLEQTSIAKTLETFLKM